jgi:hypothetical protein
MTKNKIIARQWSGVARCVHKIPDVIDDLEPWVHNRRVLCEVPHHSGVPSYSSPLVRLDHACQDVEQRALASTIGANNTQALASKEFIVKSVDEWLAVPVLCDFLQEQECK